MNKDLPVLIISTKIDTATDAVVQELNSRLIPVVRFNTEDFPYYEVASFRIGGNIKPELSFNGQASSFRSVWWRRIRAPQVPDEMHPAIHDYCIREGRAFSSGIILGLQKRVMSNPNLVWAAEHKIYQLKVATECGLEIPSTVITNSPSEIRKAFQGFDGQMIGKPLRSGFIDMGNKQRALYTTKIEEEDLDNLSDARWSPSIYQQWIPKHRDVRVTVVGKRLFTAEIDGNYDPKAIVDWRRTNDPDLPHYESELPEELEKKIRTFMKCLGLKFGAIDFVRTRDGRYFFLEVNPNGQWLWIDKKLNLGITVAVADWLEYVDDDNEQ